MYLIIQGNSIYVTKRKYTIADFEKLVNEDLVQLIGTRSSSMTCMLIMQVKK